MVWGYTVEDNPFDSALVTTPLIKPLIKRIFRNDKK